MTTSIGVNISERKSGAERTKKRKKRELVVFSPPGGATGTVECSYSKWENASLFKW